MIDKDLIQRLDSLEIINKKHVLWWQLGFEDRRIFTEEEFNQRLSIEKIAVMVDDTGRQSDQHVKEFKYWTGKDVPILLKNINIDGIDIHCFISVKPTSHTPWITLKERRESMFIPFEVCEQPHIRGVVLDVTDRFLFWYPFFFGNHYRNQYTTYASFIKKQNMWCFIQPIGTSKFYKNLIQNGWTKGRRLQKKPQHLNCKDLGFSIVPYFEFNPSERHITVYPVKLFDDKLDFPIIIKSIPEEDKGEIIGVGYLGFDPDYISYWMLDERRREMAQQRLEERLNIRLE